MRSSLRGRNSGEATARGGRERGVPAESALPSGASALAIVLLASLALSAEVQSGARTEASTVESPAASAPGQPPATGSVGVSAAASAVSTGPLPVLELGRLVMEKIAAEVERGADASHACLADRAAFLGSVEQLGIPYPAREKGRMERYVFPLLIPMSSTTRVERVCGLMHVDPYTGDIISWPAWAPGPAPLELHDPEELRRTLEEQERTPPAAAASEPLYNPIRVDEGVEHLPGAYLVRGWRHIPPKDQDARIRHVAMLNASARLRRPLRYGPGALDPPMKSLSAAAATCADWWRERLGFEHAPYEGWLNGLAQYGVNPRELEVQYRMRGFSTLPQSQIADPVTSEPVADDLAAYAALLTAPTTGMLPEPLETPDALAPTRFVIDAANYGMEGVVLEVLPGMRPRKGKADPRALAADLEQALRSHGVLLASVPAVAVAGKPRSLHGIAIIGVAQVAGDWLALFQEIHGDRGHDFPLAGTGSPRLKGVRVTDLSAAYAFPHRLELALHKARARTHFQLLCLTGGGQPIDLDRLDARLEGAVKASVSLGGRTLEGTSASRTARGSYRITVPREALRDPNARLQITADREYFRRHDGTPYEATFTLEDATPLEP